MTVMEAWDRARAENLVAREIVPWAERELGFQATPTQAEVLKAVVSHPNTVIRSCNGWGKSAIAAIRILHWLATNRPAKVIATAKTHRQVNNQLWAEVRRWGQAFADRRGWELSPRTANLKTQDPQTFGLGFATDSTARLEGFHSPNLLVVVDEAREVPEEIYQGVDRLQPVSRLYISTPGSPRGRFYDCFHSSNWHAIHIDAEALNLEEERVSPTWVRDQLETYGQTSPFYAQSVKGEFSEVLESPYFNPSHVESSFTIGEIPVLEGDLWLSIDWGERHDYTALVEGRGTVVTRVDTMQADYMSVIAEVAARNRARPYSWIVADEGEGIGQISRMRELGLPVEGRRWTRERKLEDLSSLKLALESGTIRFAPMPSQEPDRTWAREQLLAYQRIPTPSGDSKFSAPPGQHDDIVTALAIAYGKLQGRSRYGVSIQRLRR